MNVIADGMTIIVALRHFSKRFAEGKGGLSHDELARATQLGSDALARSLSLLASPPATKALDPDPFPRHSLRHAVYDALLHFGFETAHVKRSSDCQHRPFTRCSVPVYDGAESRVIAGDLNRVDLSAL